MKLVCHRVKHFSSLLLASAAVFHAALLPCAAQTGPAPRDIPPPFSGEKTAPITAVSTVNWQERMFTTNISLDMEQNGLSLPTGKISADSRVAIRIPSLIKDPLLSLCVDSERCLADMVGEGQVTLEELADIIAGGKRRRSAFDPTGKTFQTEHLLGLASIAQALTRRRGAYEPPPPIEREAARPYTGLLIDARGMLPVRGEHITARAKACLFPRIWDSGMDTLYERSVTDPEAIRRAGGSIVCYAWSGDEPECAERIGADPLRVSAREIFGKNLTDPVISRADALKILSIPENRALLTAGRVAILLDKDALVHTASFPDKDSGYYERYAKLRADAAGKNLPDTAVADAGRGVEISVQNLNFEPDQAAFLPGEEERLNAVADMLLGFITGGDYTIAVEGHTADVGRPAGELALSIQRAQTVADALAARGIPPDVFVIHGYGGIYPLADNSTAEGRAKNRRVELIIMPRGIGVQRVWD